MASAVNQNSVWPLGWDWVGEEMVTCSLGGQEQVELSLGGPDLEPDAAQVCLDPGFQSLLQVLLSSMEIFPWKS